MRAASSVPSFCSLTAANTSLRASRRRAHVLLEHVLRDGAHLAHHVAEDVAVHLVEGVRAPSRACPRARSPGRAAWTFLPLTRTRPLRQQRVQDLQRLVVADLALAADLERRCARRRSSPSTCSSYGSRLRAPPRPSPARARRPPRGSGPGCGPRTSTRRMPARMRSTMSRSTVMRSFSGRRRLLEMELAVVPLEDAVDDLRHLELHALPQVLRARARPSPPAPCPGACPRRWP